MPIYEINSPDDPRLTPYRNMKDRELARLGKHFIAEGENVVRRLLNSTFGVESVLVARRKLEAIASAAKTSTVIFSAPDEVIEHVIGFEFHSGVLACGVRPPPGDVETVLAGSRLLAVCQQITNTENLGSLIRVAAAFGVDGMMLGESCCDPFFRQSVRVSMGSVFTLPMVRSDNLLSDLDRLNEAGVETFATVLNGDAEPLSSVDPPKRAAIVFGNEAQGLDAMTIAHCRRRVTIPMRLGTDSLNVAIAAGVFLYHFSVE